MSRKKTISRAKKAAKTRASKPKSIQTNPDFVRTVPLHYPKPSYALDELVKADLESPDTDLFDGKPHFAPADAWLTYRNGPLLQNVEVFTVFWGTKWKSSSTAPAVITKTNQFFHDILTSSLIDQLAEYNAGGQKIGHGKFTGTITITDSAPVGSVTDATIRTQLKKWI
ncbi:MAG TPA: hypothetical protein VET48_07595, partial [Steroidobacteraceae bacterium]|nr:hypothetical protein [Steroidobacteraceae bacterium]